MWKPRKAAKQSAQILQDVEVSAFNPLDMSLSDFFVCWLAGDSSLVWRLGFIGLGFLGCIGFGGLDGLR